MHHLHIYETEKKLALWDDIQEVLWKWSYVDVEHLNEWIKEVVAYKGSTHVSYVTKINGKDRVYKIESYREGVKFETEEGY